MSTYVYSKHFSVVQSVVNLTIVLEFYIVNVTIVNILTFEMVI